MDSLQNFRRFDKNGSSLFALRDSVISAVSREREFLQNVSFSSRYHVN